MSILFGCYSMKGFTKGLSSPRLEKDLTLDGKRRLIHKHFENLVLFQAQPIEDHRIMTASNEDESLYLIFAGFLFDFRKEGESLRNLGHEFKHKDMPAEFLIHYFEEYGAARLHELKGNFSFALWDNAKKELILVNDLFGLHPLYIDISDGMFVFSSEYQPILTFKKSSFEVNLESIAEYFLIGATLGEKTFIRSITNTTPASIIKINKSGYKINKYQVHNFDTDQGKSPEYFAEHLNEHFKKAVITQLTDYGVKYCDLSGGFDTRFILGSIPLNKRKEIQFNTACSSKLSKRFDKDVVAANLITKKLKLRHVISKDAKKSDFGPAFFEEIRYCQNKLVPHLSGLYGGELLGGAFLKIASSFAFPKEKFTHLKAELKRYFSDSFIRRLGSFDDLKKHSANSAEIKAHPLRSQLFPVFSMFTRSFFTSIYGSSVRDWLYPPSNFYSYARLFPFLDHQLLKMLFLAPSDYLRDYKLYLLIMKRFHPNLMKFPYASCGVSDNRVKQLTLGEHYFNVKANSLEEFLWFCKSGESFWSKANFNSRTRQLPKIALKMAHLRRKIPALNLEIRKFIHFEAWLKQYCPRETFF